MGIAIQFLGAAGGVTGSQFLVSVGERRILVECGMFQGSPEEIARNRLPFAFDPRTIDAVLLTHAHLDHCGRLPGLVKAGYRGPVYATAATIDLAEIVLRDSAKLQMEFAARWRRHHPDAAAEAEAAAESAALGVDDEDLPARLRRAPREGRTETREALYTETDVDQTMRQARGVDYGAVVGVSDGASAIFHDAGHILGSAIIELRVNDGRESATIVFSGDLGRDDTPIVRDPTPLAHADYVVIESTYGNREHAPYEAAEAELVEAISDVARDRGVLLVPAFAIGRTQELVWTLDELVRRGRIPRVPLYLDSPMAGRATAVYHDHPEIFDEQTSALLEAGDTPLDYPGQQFTETVEQSKAIRRARRPIMVVASSGMLTGGRIMHHLKDFLPDLGCTLLFIGYQGEGTLGRHIQDGARSARIDGHDYQVRCRVRSISGFSAHADQHELEAWLANFGGPAQAGRKPRTVFIVHGDPDAATAFAERISGQLGMRAHVARHREQVTLSQEG